MSKNTLVLKRNPKDKCKKDSPLEEALSDKNQDKSKTLSRHSKVVSQIQLYSLKCVYKRVWPH